MHHCHNKSQWITRSGQTRRGIRGLARFGRSWAEPDKRRWRLQIYGEVAARTWQQQNPDGASSVRGLSQRREPGDSFRAPELCFEKEKNPKNMYVRGAWNIRPEFVGSLLAKGRDLTRDRAHHPSWFPLQHHPVFTFSTHRFCFFMQRLINI